MKIKKFVISYTIKIIVKDVIQQVSHFEIQENTDAIKELPENTNSQSRISNINELVSIDDADWL